MPLDGGEPSEMSAPKMLRVPVKLKNREMLIGTLDKLEGVLNLAVVVEDEGGIWLMLEDGSTAERLNWMLDRAKRILHE